MDATSQTLSPLRRDPGFAHCQGPPLALDEVD